MTRRGRNTAAVAGLMAVLCLTVPAQESKGTHRKVRVVDPTGSAIAQAESLMEKKDFEAAEKQLLEISVANPKDYRAWFDLGYVYSATDRKEKAIEAYRRSIAAQPGVLEPNLNLAFLLVERGDSEAGRYLRAAEKLKPTADAQKRIARAWLSLGDQLQPKDRAGAIDAYEQGARLNPNEAYPHLQLGQLYEAEHQDKLAEQQYKAALAADENSKEAISLLIGQYLREDRKAEAETMLRTMAAKQPGSAATHLQLGRVLASEAKHEEAIGEFEKALQLAPTDADAQKNLVASQMALKQYDKAAATLRVLLTKDPQNADLHFMMGDLLMKAKNFAGAQDEFLAAAKLRPKWADPLGGLAFAASESKNYDLAVRALDARAKLTPETPQTYFLRATCLDNLGDKKNATVYYKEFLKVSNGKMPDQEWQASHRLIAIDPETRKKAK